MPSLKHFQQGTMFVQTADLMTYTFLQRLYSLGARRVLVTGTGPLGCVPAELAQRSKNGECAVELQQATDTFNPMLIEMISQLNKEIGSDAFVAVNAKGMQNDFIHNPQAFGLCSPRLTSIPLILDNWPE